jgi:hypothetical protein
MWAKDDGQKECCQKCGISRRSPIECAETTLDGCAYLQRIAMRAATNAGEMQSSVSILAGYEDRINSVITKLMKPDIK